MALCPGGLRKGTIVSAWPAFALMPDISVSPYIPLVCFQLLPQCWSLERVSLSKSWVHCRHFKRRLLRILQFLPPSQPSLVFTARMYGTYLPGPGTLGCVVWFGAVIPRSWGIPPNFYLPHVNVGPPIPYLCVFCVSIPPTDRNEYDFFNSLVVGLAYSSIFWWLWVIIVL